jgi:DNA-3-methyladenine glycosylase II
MQEALLHLKSRDPILGRVIDEVGPYGIEFRDPNFETLVKAIIYQQLSGKVASIIFARLQAAAGNGRLTPEGVLKLRLPKMRALGLSQQKITYIRELARGAASGAVDLEAMVELSDEDVYRQLTSLKGIGVWTAQMFLMFALRRHDVLPAGDLGIRAAVRKLYGFEAMPTPAQVQELARNWRPYCTVASWYLWRSLEPNASL